MITPGPIPAGGGQASSHPSFSCGWAGGWHQQKQDNQDAPPNRNGKWRRDRHTPSPRPPTGQSSAGAERPPSAPLVPPPRWPPVLAAVRPACQPAGALPHISPHAHRFARGLLQGRDGATSPAALLPVGRSVGRQAGGSADKGAPG